MATRHLYDGEVYAQDLILKEGISQLGHDKQEWRVLNTIIKQKQEQEPDQQES